MVRLYCQPCHERTIETFLAEVTEEDAQRIAYAVCYVCFELEHLDTIEEGK